MLNLFIDGKKIIEEDSYSVTVSDILTDTAVQTEAGTKQYDYARRNVHTISLSYTVTDQWLHVFSKLRNQNSCSVSFYDETSGDLVSDLPMKVANYSYDKMASLKRRNVFSVSFDLEEI